MQYKYNSYLPLSGISNMLSKLNVEINERFLATSNVLMDNYGFRSVAAFARKLDIHPQFFTDFKNFKMKVSALVLRKLSLVFPEANISYVLTGKGEVIKSPYNRNEAGTIISDNKEIYLKKLSPEECEKLKLDYLLIRERCEAYEKVFKMLKIEHTKFLK